MSTNPAPRPALRKAPDRSVHPAAPRLVPLETQIPPQPADEPSRKDKDGKAKSGGKGKGKVVRPATDEPTVELVVPMPKPMRKRLKAKAADHGYTPEEAAYQLLRVWVDG